MGDQERHAKDGWPLLAFVDAGEFERWLEEHHGQPTGLWLKIAKKGSGIPSITYDQAVDVALCFGWIDGQKNSYDHDWFLQRFSPRRPRSIWSKVNTEKVDELTKAGRMRPPGLAEVQKAKNDGRWAAAYGRQSDMPVPLDLQRFLDENDDAAEFFGSLSSTNRYAFLFRLQTARRPETRAKRFAEFTSMLKAGKKFYS